MPQALSRDNRAVNVGSKAATTDCQPRCCKCWYEATPCEPGCDPVFVPCGDVDGHADGGVGIVFGYGACYIVNTSSNKVHTQPTGPIVSLADVEIFGTECDACEFYDCQLCDNDGGLSDYECPLACPTEMHLAVTFGTAADNDCSTPTQTAEIDIVLASPCLGNDVTSVCTWGYNDFVVNGDGTHPGCDNTVTTIGDSYVDDTAIKVYCVEEACEIGSQYFWEIRVPFALSRLTDDAGPCVYCVIYGIAYFRLPKSGDCPTLGDYPLHRVEQYSPHPLPNLSDAVATLS